MKVLLISPCHYKFGGWYRASNIARALEKLNTRVQFVYNRRYYSNIITRVMIGIRNCYHVAFGNYDVVHVFELIQPETVFCALLAKVLRKKVVIDLGDEWTFPPLRYRLNHPPFIRHPLLFVINLLEKYAIRLFPAITVGSSYLLEKIQLRAARHKLVLINGVDLEEFEVVDRREARDILWLPQDQSVLLAFGNTFDDNRQKLLDELCDYIKYLRPGVKVIQKININIETLRLYLGACDMILFPTGCLPNERGCFPCRVGTMLNAERVIATDNSGTEFHNTLIPYNCMVTARNMHALALMVVGFLDNKELKEHLEHNVRIAKQHLCWQNIIRRLHEFYLEV